MIFKEEKSYKWLVTGVAGFIGSHLLEELLKKGQSVIGIDNFETGKEANLNDVYRNVGDESWKNFEFFKKDITNFDEILGVFKNIDIVCHQAALGSVPRSFKHPLRTNEVNISGFLNILECCRQNNIKNFVYASSSSTYGDSAILPKKENLIGRPLSPYAITKYVNELYAYIYSKHHGVSATGLRYFNVFGPRQNANGSYAAVIPKWMHAIIDNTEIIINGDGSTSRDFCYIKNVVQANFLSVDRNFSTSEAEIYNIAYGESNNLTTLYELLVNEFKNNKHYYNANLKYQDFREGDIHHSLADIDNAKKLLNYSPEYDLRKGIKEFVPWFINNSSTYA